MITIEAIKNKLNLDFNPSVLDIEDDSHKHAGHFHLHNKHPQSDIGVTHITVTIKSLEFLGKSPVMVHRAIYKSLDEFIKLGLHAIKIQQVK